MPSACLQEQKTSVEDVLATAVRSDHHLMTIVRQNGLPSPNVEETVKGYLDRMNQHNHDVKPLRDAVTLQYDITAEQLPPPRYRY